MMEKVIPPVNTQEIYGYGPGSTKVHRNINYETGDRDAGVIKRSFLHAGT